jgi:hypothetical protein
MAVGCKKPFELPVLDPQAVPAEVREQQPWTWETEVVWRVYERAEEYVFEAYTCVVVFDGMRSEQFHIRARWLDENGATIGLCSGSGDLKPRFWSATGGGTGYDYEERKPVFSLSAMGSAFDSRVTTVVGMTDTGRRLEAKVFSGFWALDIEPAEYRENWVSLTAVRADGSVVHRYEMPQPSKARFYPAPVREPGEQDIR